MSWSSYIETLMVDKSVVMDAAICGLMPNQQNVWASSDGLKNITEDEIKKLSLSENERGTFAQNGVYIAGQRCRMLRDQLDTENIYALHLKTAADKNGDTFGVCVGKTEKALIIVKGTKDANGGQLSNLVYRTVEYLRQTEN